MGCKGYFSYIFALTLLGITTHSLAQQPHGDRAYTRWGIMDGNLVRTKFANHGEVAEWPEQPSCEWPKGSGHSYVDGVAPFVAIEVMDVEGKIIHIMETQYREFMDISPEGEPMGWTPLPGYCNPFQDSPAISDDPNSWPEFWPDKLDSPDDPGWRGIDLETGIDSDPDNAAWNGYFGKVIMADLETYFVMDDYNDKEYKYYPDPSDPSRGGLGLRVGVRGFQWSHVLAEDVIFWHYDITNISAYDYKKVLFGMYMDSGVGGSGDSSDDNGLFDTLLDITIAYDGDGIGDTNWGPTGVVGYAFLESPGNPYDGIDNDEDGLVDERRDDGIDNDGDWVPFTDLNGNGKWDGPESGEPLNSDVGADGLSNLDPDYPGPDEGEGDGVPSHGEPEFDETDKDESDQIGLTSVKVFVLHEFDIYMDEEIWDIMTPGKFDTSENNTNLGILYGSGYFPLAKGQTERFSMALLFGEDFDDLKRNKETVQQIYNGNYRFARPPIKPTVKAVPGDHRVTLYWDRKAEDSRDPFLGYKKDFEGYLIYRSTDASFFEPKTITDAYGVKTFRKPMAQFDLIDGIVGPDPVGIYGARFNRGSDTGLRHTWTDSTVENGQTYYYAVVSYDQGDPEVGTQGLSPTECTSIIRTDDFGHVVSTDINTVVVTPNAPATGYRPPELDGETQHVSGPGTGSIVVGIIDSREVKDNHRYQIAFAGVGPLKTISYSVYDVTSSPADTLVNDCEYIGRDAKGFPDEGPLFDGLRVLVYNDGFAYDPALSGWIEGNCNFESIVEVAIQGEPYPADYELRFAATVVDTSANNILTYFMVWNVTEQRKSKFRFRDSNRDGHWDANEYIEIREEFEGVEKSSWKVTLADTTMVTESIKPGEGDVFLIHVTKPFRSGDVFEVNTRAAYVDQAQVSSALDKIAVVPNPYVAAASWEPKHYYTSGRGPRKLDFIHLPQRCTIRIYTTRGELVDMLEHDSSMDDGAESWDLRSKDGMDISYGIYVYHVDAPEVGEKIGKFAVIK